MASNNQVDTFALTVRYTVEYTVLVEGTRGQAREFAHCVPTPLPSADDPEFFDMVTNTANQLDVIVGDVLEVDVCGGYVELGVDGYCFDRIDFV
jgi:hypothetical protein